MAKKSKTRRKPARRSRRRGRSVSGIGMAGVPIETLAAVGAGAVASKALNGVLSNVKALEGKPIVRPIIKLGVGYLLTAYKGGGQFVQSAGMGFIAEGALDMLGVAAPNVFSKLTGEPGEVGAVTLIDLDEVNGYGSVDTNVAGYEDDTFVM